MRVVVIGAGLAGLSAAWRLQQAGFSPTVLEARDRVGGRTHTLREGWGGQHVELGAELVDAGQVAMIGLCSELGLALTAEVSYAEPEIVFGGRRLTASEREDLLAEMEETFVAQPPEPHEPQAAWGRRARVSAHGMALLDATSRMTPMSAMRECDTHLHFEMPSGGQAWRIADGTDALAHALAADLDVRLGSPVTAVRVTDEGVVVATGEQELTCDRVVVAVPAPVLAEIGFDPPLPAAKVHALLSLPYGRGGKVVARYENVPGLAEALAGGCATDGSPALVWDTATHQDGDAVIAGGLVGGDGGAALRHEDAALDELDALMSKLADAPVRRSQGRVMDWSADRYARGPIPAPFDRGRRLAPLLAAACGPLHFAGDHTDLVWGAYMEGAVRSGRRAALEVLEEHALRRAAGDGTPAAS